MKKLILVLLILIPMIGMAQLPIISEVVPVDNKTADQLYSSGKEWIYKAVNDPKESIILDSSDEKKIYFKANRPFQFRVKNILVEGRYFFKFNCQFRDQRYKYDIEITDVRTGEQTFTFDYYRTLTDYNAMRQYWISLGITLLREKNIKESAENVSATLIQIESDIALLIAAFKEYVSKNDNTDW